MHHARLKNVFEKLIVVDGPPCLDFQYPAKAGCMRVGVEALQYLVFSSEKHLDNDLVFGGFPSFDSKSEVLQSWP